MILRCPGQARNWIWRSSWASSNTLILWSEQPRPGLRFYLTLSAPHCESWTEKCRVPTQTPPSEHSQHQGTSLTLLEAIAEGAGAAHGAALVVQGHGAVAKAHVAVGVVGPVSVGQAVRAQHAGVGQAHLRCARGACCKAATNTPLLPQPCVPPACFFCATTSKPFPFPTSRHKFLTLSSPGLTVFQVRGMPTRLVNVKTQVK